jgi:hypothetical protein
MRTYTTISGDTWDKIAMELLGSEYLFPLLLKANPSHRHVLVFSAGTVLNVPDIEADYYSDVPTWLTEEETEEFLNEEETAEVASEADSQWMEEELH